MDPGMSGASGTRGMDSESPVSQPRLVQPLLLLLVFLSVCDASTPWGRHIYKQTQAPALRSGRGGGRAKWKGLPLLVSTAGPRWSPLTSPSHS